MRNTLIFSFLYLHLAANAQWSSTVTLNSFNNNLFTIDHFCVANENSVFAGGKKRETLNSAAVGVFFYTLDGGAVWDSLEFADRFISAIESPSPNVVYYVSTKLVFPTVGSTYAKKYLHRSMDSGQTWNESLIDSSSFGLMYNALAFFNDSTGILRLGSSNYFVTRDYGQNWTPINLPAHQFSTTLGGDTLLLNAQNISTINLTTLDLTASIYSAYCVGSLFSYDKSSVTLIRAYLANDGTSKGYPYMNYLAVSLDDYPLGGQQILHFPDFYAISAKITENNIYLLSHKPACSNDGGNTFFIQESTEPDADTSVFMHLDFANDQMGYAVTHSLADNTYKIQKTTNGGGITTNYIDPPIQITAGINEPSKNEVTIYPNPTSQNVTVSSAVLIDCIEIIDLFGRSILSIVEINDHDYNLDLSNYSNGNYILKVSSKSHSEYYPLVKN
jgi:hypothetical protein